MQRLEPLSDRRASGAFNSWECTLGDALAAAVGAATCAIVFLSAWQWWRGEPPHVAALPLAVLAAVGGLVCVALFFMSIAAVLRYTAAAPTAGRAPVLEDWDGRSSGGSVWTGR